MWNIDKTKKNVWPLYVFSLYIGLRTTKQVISLHFLATKIIDAKFPAGQQTPDDYKQICSKYTIYKRVLPKGIHH